MVLQFDYHRMKRKKGFSLVELVVSISVIMFISTIIFINFPKFKQVTAVDNAARELALAFRDAQSRAVAVSINAGGPRNNYGVYTTRVGANKQVIIFSDIAPENKRYDAGVDIVIKTITLFGGARVESYADAAVGNPNVLNVIYYRPDPTTEVSDGSGILYNQYGPFTINVLSQDSAERRKVIIWRTGQVSITQ